MNSEKVGIIEIAYALPKKYIKAETHANGNADLLGKLKVGLGIIENSIMSEGEDPITLAKDALVNLLNKAGISENDIGRLEVGSESNPDSAKSIKSHLMSLFSENKDICGVDNIQACYGGTAALLNSAAWVMSPFWNGRYAIVVCADGYFYENENLHPLCSGGAVAMLVGRNPVFSINNKINHFFDDKNDFLKPKSMYPKTIIDGKLSISVYNTCFKACYLDNSCEHHIFHAPYPKLIKKIATEYNIKNVETSLMVSERSGNAYTASIYFCLISLLENAQVKVGDRISCFSFGSGCSSSLFILTKEREGCEGLNVKEELDKREEIGIDDFKRLVSNYFKKPDS